MSELRKARIGSEVTERRREMSLVDYASSSDDDVSEAEEQEQKDEQSLNPNDQPQSSTYQPSPPPQ